MINGGKLSIIVAIAVFTVVRAAFGQEDIWTSGGPFDASIYSIAIHPFDNQRLYIGTLERFIYLTTDGGGEWAPVEDTLNGRKEAQTVRVVKIHPFGPDSMYAATVSGVYKSTDAGQTWFNMFPERPYSYIEWPALEITRGDPPVLFIGSWGHAWRSIDGGLSWSRIFEWGVIEPIKADPVSPNIIYLGQNTTSRHQQIWKSTDSGVNWENIHHNLQFDANDGVFASQIEVDPVDHNIIYFSRKDLHGIGEALVKSTNGGEFWTDITPPGLYNNLLYGVAVSHLDHNLVFVCTDGNGVIRSTDGGESWMEINEGISSASSRAQSVAVDSATGIIYLGWHSGGMYRSTNNGDSWEKISYNIIGAQCFDIAANWRDLDTLYTATKGGLYMSADGAHSWDYVELNLSGYSARTDYVEVDPYDPSFVYASHYHMTDQGRRGAFYRSSDGGNYWESFDEGLLPDRSYGNIKVANYGDGTRRLFMTSSSGLFYSDDLGESWSLCRGGLPRDIDCGGLDVSLANPNLVYIGDYSIPCNLYKSSNSGETWQALIDIPEGEAIERIACDPIDPEVIYISIGWSLGLFKSTDGGRSWENINNNLPRDTRYFGVGGIAINPLSHNNLLVYSNMRGIFQSHNGGQNWEDFFNNSFRATAFVSAILINPIDTGEVLLATSNSVWSINRTVVGVDDEPETAPTAFSAINYPNPFNPSTTIEYNLPEHAFVTIDIYNLLGRKVERLAGEDQRAGNYRIIWDAKDKASGLYFYRICAGQYSSTGVMALLK